VPWFQTTVRPGLRAETSSLTVSKPGFGEMVAHPASNAGVAASAKIESVHERRAMGLPSSVGRHRLAACPTDRVRCGRLERGDAQRSRKRFSSRIVRAGGRDARRGVGAPRTAGEPGDMETWSATIGRLVDGGGDKVGSPEDDATATWQWAQSRPRSGWDGRGDSECPWHPAFASGATVPTEAIVAPAHGQEAGITWSTSAATAVTTARPRRPRMAPRAGLTVTPPSRAQPFTVTVAASRASRSAMARSRCGRSART
jgi:hypothetical protein